MTRTLLCILFTLILNSLIFAQTVARIKGIVTDQSSLPVTSASITLQHGELSRGTLTDNIGKFTIDGMPVGRYDLRITCTGYEPVTVRQVFAGSGKETFLQIILYPRVATLQELIVREGGDISARHSAAATSVTRLGIEEAQRYAGGFDDPARLVSSMAGVSGNIGNNAIIVRGNNPQSLQWKMEGVEIPSPNHLGDLRSFGGGSVTALSIHSLGNTDFFSGAMPAEYSNALSGVLDISMRTGNEQKHEHTFQVGVVGIDAASEGPFRKGGKASYLFNYRYSTLALVGPLLAENAGGIRYQDLSFKLYLPTQRAGTFSVWGIGLTDRVSASAKKNVSAWAYDEDNENHTVTLQMGAAGVGHALRFNTRQTLKSTLAATQNSIYYPVEAVDSNFTVRPKSLLDNGNRNLIFTTALKTRFSHGHTNRTGFTITSMHYTLHIQNMPNGSGPLQQIVNESGRSTLVSAYTQSTFKPSERLMLNAGLTAQYFALTEKYSIEPRMNAKYQLTGGQSLGVGYGLHSRAERLNYYFLQSQENQVRNRPLNFTKAHHFVLGYNLNPSDFRHLKVEAYYQYLFNVPVIDGTSFSMINQQGDWFFNGELENAGQGRNMGIDITFQKYLSKGYYYLTTASLFRSHYRGGDLKWRSTRYDRNFAFHFLIGKEWFAGKSKRNVFSANVNLSYQGSDRYSPVDLAASRAANAVVFSEDLAFSRQYPAAFVGHLTLSCKMNRRKTASELALKVLNLNQYQEYVGFQFNHKTGEVDMKRELVIIPNLSYRIDF